MSVSTSRYIPRKSQPEKQITTKGATEALKVDKNEIERILINLRKNSDVLLNEENSQLNAQVKIILDNAKKLYKTTGYKDFFDQILKHFSNVKNILPGTISALMVGNYFYKGDLPSKSYAPTCINSLPLPEEEISTQDDKNISVVYRDRDSSTSIVKMLKNNSRIDNIVVLMGDITIPTSYLYKNELDLLKDINVEKYDLYAYINGYYTRCNARLELKNGYIKRNKYPKYILNNRNSNYTVGFVFLMAIILLIIITTVLIFSKRKN